MKSPLSSNLFALSNARLFKTTAIIELLLERWAENHTIRDNRAFSRRCIITWNRRQRVLQGFRQSRHIHTVTSAFFHFKVSIGRSALWHQSGEKDAFSTVPTHANALTGNARAAIGF